MQGEHDEGERRVRSNGVDDERVFFILFAAPFPPTSLLMHELALMQSLVDAVSEQVGDARVTTVRLEVGRLSCVVPDALLFCFDVCVNGTALEGATIEIEPVDGRGRCRACGRELAVSLAGAVCSCGGVDVELLAGDELRLKEVEVI